MRIALISFLIVLHMACTVPVLDTPMCLESRDVLKKTYSIYIDAFEKETKERLEIVKDRLSEKIRSKALASKDDYLTRSKSPVGARIGHCAEENGQVVFEVKVFIKAEKRAPTEENLTVKMKKADEKWIIDSVALNK